MTAVLDDLPDRGGRHACAPPLLEVRDLAVCYRRGRGRVVRAVDGVSLRLERGETLGVVGESGSGKSTLAKGIVRLEAAAGSIRLNGTELAGLGESQLRPLRRQVQMVFQDSLGSLNPRRSIGQTLTEPLLVHRLASSRVAWQRAADLMARVGLSPELLHQRPGHLSGGQRQRVNIARALASEPGLVIADEPTSALDVSVQAQILSLLQDLQRETGVGYLFISHDLGVIRRMASRVAVMYLGKVVETGGRGRLYERPLHPYTRLLMRAAPRPDPGQQRQQRHAPIPGEVPSAASPPSGCRFHPRCPMAREVCAVEEPGLREVAPGQLSACHFAEELLELNTSGALPSPASTTPAP